MPHGLIAQIAEVDEHCCTYDFWYSWGVTGQSIPNQRANRLADNLGLGRATIYRWNKKIRDGACCPCKACANKEP